VKRLVAIPASKEDGERLVLELKDKVQKINARSILPVPETGKQRIEPLKKRPVRPVNLGYKNGPRKRPSTGSCRTSRGARDPRQDIERRIELLAGKWRNRSHMADKY